MIRRAQHVTRTVAVRAAPIVRRVGGVAARAAMDEKHTLAAVGGAALLGYLDKNGHLDNVSLVDGVDPKVQVGLLAWAAGRFTKNRMVQHVATGALSVAVYSMIKEG